MTCLVPSFSLPITCRASLLEALDDAHMCISIQKASSVCRSLSTVQHPRVYYPI
jgi:hypothetical protein